MAFGPYKKQPSTEQAPNKRDKGPPKPKKKHPLAPPPAKDPKARQAPSGGVTNPMVPPGRGDIGVM